MRLVEWDERPRVRDGDVPRHVALIMDGNRRWAASRGISVSAAHQAAAPALMSCLEEACYLGVQYITVFALGSRNLLRSDDEVESLKRLREWLWTPDVIKTLNALQAQVQLIGQTDQEWIRREVMELEPLSRPPDPALTVSFAVNHSARAENDAALAWARAGAPDKDAGPSPWTPPIDLLIRTGGEQRLSDFMLMELADAELVFTDTLWPDFHKLQMSSVISEYQQRRRRFGR